METFANCLLLLTLLVVQGCSNNAPIHSANAQENGKRTLEEPTAVLKGEYRTWENSSGTLKVVARFDSFLPADRVRLALRDQKGTIEIVVADLSSTDQEYLSLLARPADATSVSGMPNLDESMRAFTKGWKELVALYASYEEDRYAQRKATEDLAPYEAARSRLAFEKKWYRQSRLIDVSVPVLITSLEPRRDEVRLNVVAAVTTPFLTSVQLVIGSKAASELAIGDVVAVTLKTGLYTDANLESLNRESQRSNYIRFPAVRSNLNRNGTKPFVGFISQIDRLTESEVERIPELQAWVGDVVSQRYTKEGGFLRPWPEVAESLGLKFAVVNAGNFTRGDSPVKKGASAKKYQVIISKAYELGIHEVTYAQFLRIMDRDFYKSVEHDQLANGNHPIKVSWDDAVRFCKLLSELPAEKAAGHVYRLPTEAEWEYACRAGKKTKFSFGNDFSKVEDYARIDVKKGVSTSGAGYPVGSKKPNAWGFFDMYGYPFEWCQDWYADNYFETAPVKDPLGPTDGTTRVVRGSLHIKGEMRGALLPSRRSAFRLVRVRN